MEYRTTVVRGGRTATGLPVPDDVVVKLGAGKRPPVQVTVGGHTYRTTVAPLGGAFWAPLAAEHQKEWVRWVLEAKRPETRATRIAKTVESLRAGRKAR
jgi:Bacteriocin-protection, YdeI or OmpD-Associated/Domain of unknown function (DUF1905)